MPKQIKSEGKTCLPSYYGVGNKFKGSKWQTLLDVANVKFEIKTDNPTDHIVIVYWNTQEQARVIRSVVKKMLSHVFNGGWPNDLIKDWNSDFYVINN